MRRENDLVAIDIDDKHSTRQLPACISKEYGPVTAKLCDLATPQSASFSGFGDDDQQVFGCGIDHF